MLEAGDGDLQPRCGRSRRAHRGGNRFAARPARSARSGSRSRTRRRRRSPRRSGAAARRPQLAAGRPPPRARDERRAPRLCRAHHTGWHRNAPNHHRRGRPDRRPPPGALSNSSLAFEEFRGGVGFTLPIARRIVTAHDGQLWSPPDNPRAGAVLFFPEAASSCRSRRRCPSPPTAERDNRAGSEHVTLRLRCSSSAASTPRLRLS